jgi:hypothetical protein
MSINDYKSIIKNINNKLSKTDSLLILNYKTDTTNILLQNNNIFVLSSTVSSIRKRKFSTQVYLP